MQESPEERSMSTLAHILCVLGWIGPLIIYLTKKDQSRYIAFHALQALYFQVAWLAISIIGWSIVMFLSFFLVGFLLFPVMLALDVGVRLWSVVGGLKVNKGEWFEYPIAGQMARKQVGI